MKESKFILHWLYGKTEVIYGFGIADAMMKAGYSNGALRALDYWEELSN